MTSNVEKTESVMEDSLVLVPEVAQQPMNFVHTNIAVIPSGARFLVQAPLKRVSKFVSVFMYLSMVVIGIVGLILITIPHKVAEFGILLSTILVCLSIAFFVTVVFMVNVRRVDLMYQIRRLEILCNGDVTVAGAIAYDIATEASTARIGIALDMMNKINDSTDKSSGPTSHQTFQSHQNAENDPTISKVSTNIRENNEEGVISADSHEKTSLLKKSKPPGPFADKPEDFLPPASERALDAVRVAMERDPLFAISESIRIIMKSTFVWVVIMPIIYFCGGYALCNLGDPFNGTELLMTAFLIGTIGPLVWSHVKEKTSEDLLIADITIKQMIIEIAEELAKREEKEKLKLEEENKMKSGEITAVSVQPEKTRVQEKANFFGIPLPFENPFVPKDAKSRNQMNDEKV